MFALLAACSLLISSASAGALRGAEGLNVSNTGTAVRNCIVCGSDPATACPCNCDTIHVTCQGAGIRSLANEPIVLPKDGPKKASLDLSGNIIKRLPKYAFQGLDELFNLNLGGNLLTTVPKDAFRGMRKLDTVELDRNSITSIHRHAFRHLDHLRTILLQYNELAEFSLDVLNDVGKDWHGVSSVNLDGNPLACPLPGYCKEDTRISCPSKCEPLYDDDW